MPEAFDTKKNSGLLKNLRIAATSKKKKKKKSPNVGGKKGFDKKKQKKRLKDVFDYEKD
jgi:hypothetical protein